MIHTLDDLRAFLLGQTTPERARAIEDEVFDDDAAYEALLDVQYDLLDASARGELSAAEQQAVETGLQPGTRDASRVVARALARRSGEAGGAPPLPSETMRSRLDARRVGAWPALAATAVAAVGLTAWLAVQNQRLRSELTGRAQPTPVAAAPVADTSAPVIARVSLSTGVTRNASAPLVSVPSNATLVELVVPVDEPHAAYFVALEGRGAQLWTRRGATRSADGAIHVWLEGALLQPGGYEVLVRAGLDDRGSLVGAFPIRIERP